MRTIGALILFILFILFSFPVLAQSSNDSFYTINDFSKGLKSHISEYMTPEGAAKDLQNVRINSEYGQLSKRPTRLKLSACNESAVNSLYRYYLSDDTQHTVSTTSTYVYSTSDSGECVQLYANASDGKRWSFVTYKDILIGVNGTDNAKKWDGLTLSDDTTLGVDGARTPGDLIADLGAPLAEQNTGSNLDVSSWYQYRVAFYNGSYYTYSLARSNPILTGSSVRDISLTDIPLGPVGTTARYVYRTEGKASRSLVTADTTFKLIATLSDNTTISYDDTMTDATWASDTAPTWATVSAGYDVTPPKTRFAAINKERLFLANDPSGIVSGKSTIYYSPVLKPDYFYYHTDYDLVRADDGDEITVMKNLLGILTIGKTRTWSKYYTSGDADTWSISDPFSFIGCVAPYSAVNGVSGIIYLGRYGLYNFNGQSSELISDVVTDRLRDILETSQSDAIGAYHDNSYYLSYTSAASGSGVNDKVLIFDLTRDAYVEDSMNVGSFSAFDSGEDAGTLYSGSSNVDGTIYAHANSFSKLNYRYLSQISEGTTIDAYVGGEEDFPIISLGDNDTWDAEAGTWDDLTTETWLMDSLTGSWTSPIVQVNASELDKLYWNESLGSTGNVTFAIRSGDTLGAVSAASWSSEFSTPSGSDVSAVTGNVYVQLRASLSSSSFSETPLLFVSNSYMIKLSYKKSGTSREPAFLSFWNTGLNTMGTEHPKRLKEIQVYYKGTSGTMTFAYTSETGVERSFTIDLSVLPSDSTRDSYFGTEDSKIFVHIPDFRDQPIGRQWKFAVSENGTEEWKVKRIIARLSQEPYTVIQGAL